MGGMLRAIETGYVQREIQEAAYRYQRAVEAQEEIVVGVNRFQLEDEPPMPLLRIDPALEQAQVERVKALRARRDAHAVEKALAKLEQAAANDGEFDAANSCVRRGLCHRWRDQQPLRRVWGEYRETSTV